MRDDTTSREETPDGLEPNPLEALTEENPQTAPEASATEAPEKKEKGRGMFSSLLNNDEEGNITSVRELFKSIEIDRDWLRRHWKFILTITVCMFCFITNRYQAEQEIIEEARLRKDLAEMKYIWLTRYSELTTLTRQSQIEELLRKNGDTTLVHSQRAPFLIRAKR